MMSSIVYNEDCLFLFYWISDLNFVSFDCSSDVLTSGPVSEEKASDVVLLIARFINSCDAGQIRLASDKCNH